ncbi:hypothetical protein ISF6_5250 [Piscinibacter sakaiensis]|uniref:Uncharacterized protein n=1 Tax=Piscinibacter sakaiensis TaxID=1547922 RepID=A0A0K8P7U9_PISS1|nr:hypothetical protein ISF6_5250 [Piscinibacter sakaiensis]
MEMVRAGKGLLAVRRARRGDYAIASVRGAWEPELGQVVHGDLSTRGEVAWRIGTRRVEAELIASGCSRSAAWDMLS